MTAPLPTGTLLGTIVYGNSCRMKNHAVFPGEKVPYIIFLLSNYSNAPQSDFAISCV
jgi:hypothetical protein